MTHCVLGHHARLDELEEVVRAARLRADAGAAVASEWLTTDHRSSDVAVHVEVADGRAPHDLFDRRRATGEEPAGEREWRRVDGVARRIHVRHALHGEQRAEYP